MERTLERLGRGNKEDEGRKAIATDAIDGQRKANIYFGGGKNNCYMKQSLCGCQMGAWQSVQKCLAFLGSPGITYSPTANRVGEEDL